MTSFKISDINSICDCPLEITQSFTDIKAEEALNLLILGNVNFYTGKPLIINQSLQRAIDTSARQDFFSIILSCVDSRVPPDVIFNRGIGDIFNMRTAGQVCSGLGIYGNPASNSTQDNGIIGSIEYGILNFSSPLLIVMGHTNCGAVKASYSWYRDNESDPSPTDPLDQINYIITGAKSAVQKALDENASYNRAAQYQVDDVLTYLNSHSNIINAYILDPLHFIYGALYDVSTGQVQFALYNRETGRCAWNPLLP